MFKYLTFYSNILGYLTLPQFSLDSLINETAVTVYNAGRKGGPEGEINDISGIAVATDAPGELLVYFENSTVPGDCMLTILAVYSIFFTANLWLTNIRGREK